MYLKRIDILGFKSFANKTTVRCDDGITAIVGPNGCGKTNILDALRWVLGEQRVSLLRGSKMEEVIFNGSRDLKPLGMAEVTLSIVNSRGVLPTEYNELQLTRRLFRSGESEYLLNKVPCRLKDITNLFYGTGMGAHSYSVIQQDMIESVISDKAEERRFLFEEAAGITKFKQRKKAALRKMEATEHDFLRLNDIYSEVRTQVNSLKRQYKKAERYQNIIDEIKNWELFLTARRVKTIEVEKRELMAEVDGLNDLISGKEAELDTISAAMESDRTEQIELEQKLTNVGNQVYEISEQAHTLENEISVLREKRANARTLIDRNQDEIKALQARSEILTGQSAEAEKELITHRSSIRELNEALAKAEQNQADADRLLLMARQAKDNENKKLVELEGRMSSGKTEEDNLNTLQTELNDQINELSGVVDKSKTTADEIISKLTVAREKVDGITTGKVRLEKATEENRSQLDIKTEEGEQLSAEISNLTASVEASQARKTLLEEMMLHYEGYESGVVAAMEVKERWSGISGTVAEKFVPVEGLEVALEAALADLSRFVICDNRSTAENIITFLKAEAKGKIGILVPDSGTLNPVVKRPEIDLPEFVGWMDSFVTTDDSLKTLMQAVLSRVAIFKEGADPTALLERLPYGFKAVSTSGMVYGKNIVSGGSDDKFPLFRRKEKVAEQFELVDRFTKELDQTKERKSQNVAAQASLRAQSAKLKTELEEITENLNEANGQLNEINYQQQTIESELSRLGKERKLAQTKLESIRSRQYSLGLDSSKLADQKNNLESDITQSGTELSMLENQAVTTQESLSRLHVTVVEARSKIEQIENSLAHNNELKTELLRTRDIKLTEISDAENAISSSTERINELETNLKATFENRSTHTGKQSELRQVQTELINRVSEKEKQVKEVRGGKDSLNEKTHKHQLRLTTLESEAGSISSRISEEYEIDIHQAETTCPDETIPIEEADQLLREKKEKLKTFGAVNLLALEEYDTAFAREKFLNEQITDLSTAKKDLQETINKINQTARLLFNETFEKVEVHFSKLFTTLFSGGEASISLVDPSDPLESDIHITARPRGKKLLPITMMSGGERALTAIALLFSLYMVKPSPFCILDEIDAPLDDANCRRFLKIIENFSSQTQFIVITHNKITMEAADNLYGVTMEQPGISKLVAVKFNERDESTSSDDLIDTHGDTEAVDESTEASEPSTDEVEMPTNGDEETELPEAIVNRITPTVIPVEDTEE